MSVNESTVTSSSSDEESSSDSSMTSLSSRNEIIKHKNAEAKSSGDEPFLLGNASIKQHPSSNPPMPQISPDNNAILSQQYQNYQMVTSSGVISTNSYLYPPQTAINQQHHYQYQRNFIQNSPQIKNESELLLSRLVSNNEKFLLNSVFSPSNYNSYTQQSTNNFNNAHNSTYMMTTTNGSTPIDSSSVTNNFTTSNNQQNWIYPVPGSSSVPITSTNYNSHSLHHQMIIPGMQ